MSLESAGGPAGAVRAGPVYATIRSGQGGSFQFGRRAGTPMSFIQRLAQDDDDDEDELGDDGPASSQRLCVDCGASAPRTRTAHTLISSKHGWRLERIPEPDG